MRNRSASCCPTSIHGIEPVVAGHPISAAYHWCYAGSKPLQCSGYHRCLSVPLNVLISRNRSRQTEAATAVWVGVEPVPAGCVRRSAGVARVTTGEHWRGLARAGATRAYPHGGCCGAAYTLIGFRNFCQKSTSTRQITQTTPAKSSTKPTTTDHTTSVINVYLRFRAVLSVIVQMSRLY